MPKTALIAGATGLTGSHCLQKLISSPEYSRIIVLTRRELDISHEKVEPVIIDYDKISDHAHLLKADDFFCCLGTTMAKAGSREAFMKVDYYYVTKLAEIAHLNEAGQFLMISALGADPNSNIFYNRIKGKAERRVIHSRLMSIKIFRPSLLLGKRSEQRTGEKLAKIVTRAIMPAFLGPLKKYKPIHARLVAEAMLKVAVKAETGIHFYESEEIRQEALH